MNSKRPNHAMERTADRCVFTFEMTSTPSLQATCALRPPSLILFSLGLMTRSTICLLLLVTAAVAGAATPEDDAKALFDQYNAAWKARDADAMARLLAPDCVIIMTEPLAGAKRARFFTPESYIKLV